MTGFSTIQASVSGSTIQASVSGASIAASVGGGSLASAATNATQQNPGRMVWAITTKSSGSLSSTVKTTTGYAAALWWTGEVQIYGAGSPSSNITVSRAIPTSGSWFGSSPKPVYVWSCTSGSAVMSGDVTSFSCTSASLAMINAYGCSSLASLSCDSNQITSLELSGCTSLAELSCFSNQIKELNVRELASLVSLYCQSNLIDELNVTGNPILQTLQCNDNSLDTLDVSGNTALYGLYCHNNQLSSLDLRRNAGLNNLNCLGNSLASINATGLSLLAGNVSDNQLSSTAINAFYSGLASGSGTLYVSGNPGISSDTPGIATQKGYTVNGS